MSPALLEETFNPCKCMWYSERVARKKWDWGFWVTSRLTSEALCHPVLWSQVPLRTNRYATALQSLGRGCLRTWVSSPSLPSWLLCWEIPHFPSSESSREPQTGSVPKRVRGVGPQEALGRAQFCWWSQVHHASHPYSYSAGDSWVSQNCHSRLALRFLGNKVFLHDIFPCE
jgi:hypothetical protein